MRNATETTKLSSALGSRRLPIPENTRASTSCVISSASLSDPSTRAAIRNTLDAYAFHTADAAQASPARSARTSSWSSAREGSTARARGGRRAAGSGRGFIGCRLHSYPRPSVWLNPAALFRAGLHRHGCQPGVGIEEVEEYVWVSQRETSSNHSRWTLERESSPASLCSPARAAYVRFPRLFRVCLVTARRRRS